MGAMATLKEKTREDHMETERTALSRSMVKGEMSRLHYVMQLAAYARIHHALETRLERENGALHQIVHAVGPKSALALSDLKSIGMPSRPSADIEDLLLLIESDIVHSDVPAFLGALYVMEGSGLGSSFLLPRLRECLALREEECRYYRGYGEATFPRWKAFGGAVDAILTDESSTAEAILAAKALFCNVRRVFELIWDEGVGTVGLRESSEDRASYAPL